MTLTGWAPQPPGEDWSVHTLQCAGCFPSSPAHLGSHPRLVPPHTQITGVCLSVCAALCSLSEKGCCARQCTQPALLTCLSLHSWQALESLGAWKGKEIQNITWTGKRKRKRTGASRQSVGISGFTVSLEDLRKRNRDTNEPTHKVG